MRIRIPVSFAVLLFAFSLCAQTNHVSVFLTDTRVDASTATFPDGVHKLSFDSRTGYGVAFDHFLSPDLAFHTSAEKAHAHAWLEVFNPGVSLSNGGTLDLNEYTAALHYYFKSAGAVRVFAGAGLARIQSGDMHSAYAPLAVKLDPKTNWLIDGGVDISTGAEGAVVLSAKYMPYKNYGAAPQNPLQVLKLNPVTLAAAFRWGF